MKPFIPVITLLIILGISGCITGPDSPHGFSLPKGDVDAGNAVFLKYQCLSCHSLEGVTQPEVEKSLNTTVRLGGQSNIVITYATLVTSVINPSHKIAKGYLRDAITSDGKSKMKVYNEVMTVQELIDLVAFLQPKYKLIQHEETRYRYYP